MRTSINRLALALSAVTLVGPAGFASADQNGQRRREKQAEKAARDEQRDARQATREAERQQREADRAARVAAHERAQADQQRQRLAAREAQARAQREAVAARSNRQAELERQRRAAEIQRVRLDAARVEAQRREVRRDVREDVRAEKLDQKRLSEQQSNRMIAAQKRRIDNYNAKLAYQTRLAKQQEEMLRRANRNAQYRYQQDYLRRLEQQRYELARLQSYNYSNDPYFYTAPQYRYSRAGRSYEVNEYAADQLRTAVDSGYSEGYRAGQADRADGFRASYRDSWAYQDANFGYRGMYVEQDEYNYYFREGFERGYQDGYNARSQYGQALNGRVNILATVLQAILGFRNIY